MEFRESKPDDLDFVMENALYPHQIDKDCRKKVCYDYTFEHDGVLLGMGGFIIQNNFTAECWVFLTAFSVRPTIPNVCTQAECMRRIREYIDIFCREHKILRLEAWVDVNFNEGLRLVKHLGFHPESRKINFLGKNKDAWLYVRFFDESI